ncbi:hypothetical protein MOF23_07305 [Bacillus inaquosorum]|uniref:hypothetical protein n=1 Tax=Bacillus inaquosorum TaxID=483913 RepID=UPI00227F92DB|nr:hypothetical protein [Bacillus inaquosorum]MCY9308784.1 hypothetical protein [Bacillus inaquosorum]
MIIENSMIKNQKHKEDIDFRRALLDKHSQLMRMYLSHNNVEQAKIQFEIIKPIFTFLNNEGETMNYYTLEDFKQDTERFKKFQ